jgi:nitrogen-specific signal transduction histidine kinase
VRSYEHKLSNITVVRLFDDKIPEMILDSFQMRQVLLNLILIDEDALKATRRGGTLTATTRQNKR